MDLQKTDATSGDQTAKSGGRQNINTTQTPFTNIKTCNSALGAQTTRDSAQHPARNYNTHCSTLPRGVISAILQLYVSPAETFRRWIRNKILRDGFEPGMFSKSFQPFLRFYGTGFRSCGTNSWVVLVSTLLEILPPSTIRVAAPSPPTTFQPFLRFYALKKTSAKPTKASRSFNPS